MLSSEHFLNRVAVRNQRHASVQSIGQRRVWVDPDEVIDRCQYVFRRQRALDCKGP
jgi:hypothetical protein